MTSMALDPTMHENDDRSAAVGEFRGDTRKTSIVSDSPVTDTDLLAHVEDVIASVGDLDDNTVGLVEGGDGTQQARPHGDRHGPLDTLCARFHDILVGRAAEALLADVDSLPDFAGLFAAPSWAWVHSRVRVGRKERGTDGTRLRLPVRVEWSDGPLVLIEGDGEQYLPWVAAGLGHSGAATVPASASMALWDPRIIATAAGIPTAVTVPMLARHEIISALHDMVTAGKTAHWETLAYLEPHITRALHAAHSNVANELAMSSGGHQPLLDETKLEAIRNRMLLGDDEHPGKVSQLLDRCLRPDAFKRVEPIKYIKEALRVDANTAVRDALGDPHIGPKIRRVARETGLAGDIDALVEEYRRLYPKDRLSRDRALAAMTVAPDVMASWRGLQPSTGG